MAKLIYSAIASLDGYVADEHGNFDWSQPDEEVHGFVNDLERPVGTHLYGRRMYEVLVYWETAHTLADQPPLIRDYAEIWQAADKVVYSRTLESVSSARTRIERSFDRDRIRQLKEQAERDISVGAPSSRPRRSRPGWSTSSTCSSLPLSWEPASGRSLMGFRRSSSCWRNVVSATASSTSAIAQHPQRAERTPRPGPRDPLL